MTMRGTEGGVRPWRHLLAVALFFAVAAVTAIGIHAQSGGRIGGPANAPKGADGVYHGWVAVPDASNPWVGFALTDETCWFQVTKLAPGRLRVSSSFWSGSVEASNATLGGPDFYLGRLENNKAFVLQLVAGAPVSLTHTSYDEHGALNYGVSGAGDMTAECMDVQ